MPRPLLEYSAGDWLRLRPPLHRWKEARYRRIDEEAMERPHRHGNLAEVRERVAGHDILVTVAFNDPQSLSLHRELAARNVRHDVHLIVDNSTDAATSERNRQICEQTGAIYLAPPPDPWHAKNGSRSHAFAMNWLWRSILRPGRPRTFGFVDHDMHATQPVDPFRWPGKLPFHGDLRWAGHRWFLWAGYCFYSYDQVAQLDLDFGLDWFCGMDTGGANWHPLYRHHVSGEVVTNTIKAVPALAGVSLADAYFEWRNGWLHEVGWGPRPDLKSQKRAALIALLKPHLGQAGEPVSQGSLPGGFGAGAAG